MSENKLYYSRDTGEFSTEYVSAEELERKQFEQRCWEMTVALAPVVSSHDIAAESVETAIGIVEYFERRMKEQVQEVGEVE